MFLIMEQNKTFLEECLKQQFFLPLHISKDGSDPICAYLVMRNASALTYVLTNQSHGNIVSWIYLHLCFPWWNSKDVVISYSCSQLSFYSAFFMFRI